MLLDPKKLDIVNLQKSITRAEAKSVHTDLSGGEWKTIKGHHVYIKNGQIIAGAGAGKTGKPVKLTKKELATHQEALTPAPKKGAGKDVKPKTAGAGKDGSNNKKPSSGAKRSTTAPVPEAAKPATKGKTTGAKPANAAPAASSKPAASGKSKSTPRAAGSVSKPKPTAPVPASKAKSVEIGNLGSFRPSRTAKVAARTLYRDKDGFYVKNNGHLVSVRETKDGGWEATHESMSRDFASARKANHKESNAVMTSTESPKAAPKTSKAKGAAVDGKTTATAKVGSGESKPAAGASGSKPASNGRKPKSAVQPASEAKKPEANKPAAPKKESSKAGAKKAEVAPPSEATMEATRKFKVGEYQKWFTGLPASERKSVMEMKDVPRSKYSVGMSFTGDGGNSQHVLNVFSHLRAQSGLSKTKAGKETSKKGVKDTRHQAQENKTVAYDVGEKVGGARKDLATIQQRFEADPSAQDLASLEEQYPEAAQKLVTKKTLLKPLDWEAERDNGVDVNAAMAKKLVYDRIATAPANNTPLDRMLYFNAMRNIQRVLEPIKTWEQFRDATRELGQYMGKETARSLSSAEFMVKHATQKVNENNPREHDLTEYGAHYDRTKEEWVVPKGAKEKWAAAQQQNLTKKLEELETVKKIQAVPLGLPLGEKFHDFFTDYKSRERTFDTIRGKRLTWEKYFADKENAPKRSGGTSEGEEKPLRAGEERARIPLGQAQRKGGRKSNVAKPEDMVKNFNFRGVEFGNYVNDDNGKHHLIKASEAFQDLADVLGMKDKDISLNGRLAMAFGARGKGGALAHYEPMSKVINMTRDAGAGTLAHEWGHGLDNILHAQSIGSASIGFASDGIGDKGSSLVHSAYEGLMDAINKGDGKMYIKPDGKSYSTPADWRDHHELPFHEAFAKVRKKVDDDHQRQIDMNDRYYAGNLAKLKQGYASADANRDKSLLNRYHALASLYKKHGKEVPDYAQPTYRSQYRTEADKLCKGKEGYWNRKHELFARAFESYVLDKLGAGGRQNDYLVAGTTDHRTYPQGKERELINSHFDNLMEAVNADKALEKGLAFDLQKSLEPENGLTQRFAYEVPNPEGVIYIPVNRLQRVYQTAEATNWDKVKSNMDRMQAGEALEPVVIGYDHDIHDGHHRWEAAKLLDHTHVPCQIKGTNPILLEAAQERYNELWKAFDESKHPRAADGKFGKKAAAPKAKADPKTKAKAAPKPKKPKLVVEEGASEDHVTIFHGTALVNAKAIQEKGFATRRSGNGDLGKCAYFKSPEWDKHESDDWGHSQRTVNYFAADSVEQKGHSTPAVIKAVIDRKHLLDCTKGRPKELQDMIDATRTHGRKDATPRWDKNSSPYEAYAKKHGIKAIIDKLDTAWEEEGYQIGVYDPKIIKILDVGKGLDGVGSEAQLRKAIARALAYCLLHHEFDADGNLILHVGAN